MDFGTAGRLLVFLDSDRRDPAWALLAHLGSTRRQSASASGIGSLAATLGRWSGAGCESGGQELVSLRARQSACPRRQKRARTQGPITFREARSIVAHGPALQTGPWRA